MSRDLRPTDKAPDWTGQTMAERIHLCRSMLMLHHFLPFAESEKVKRRQEKRGFVPTRTAIRQLDRTDGPPTPREETTPMDFTPPTPEELLASQTVDVPDAPSSRFWKYVEAELKDHEIRTIARAVLDRASGGEIEAVRYLFGDRDDEAFDPFEGEAS